MTIQTLYDILAKEGRLNKFYGDVGLEIETETKQAYDIPKFTFWNVHGDGSLRNFGQEYVLKQPLKIGNELQPALEEFKEKTKGIPFDQDSISTSVHVHLNMLNDNLVTLGNYLTAYILVENLLVRYAGEDRRSNLFCLPICDAEETYKYAESIFLNLNKSKNAKYFYFDPHLCKYAALNLSALHRFGSLEVRLFRGVTDINLIDKWVHILHQILEYSRQKIIPPNIVEGWRDKGPELLTDIFGEHRKDLRHIDEEKLVEKNFWYACSVAYAVKEWESLLEEKKEKHVSAKEMERYAKELYNKKFEELHNHEKKLVVEYIKFGGQKKKKSVYDEVQFVPRQVNVAAGGNAPPQPQWILDEQPDVPQEAFPQEDGIEDEFLDEPMDDEEDI